MSFFISVIIPVYNAEDYLEETIESVICQSIGFEHIQLILVDDGSVDGSKTICENYQARYPRNILYIRKENGGVSSARNEGLQYAEGKYINFLDSDDKWELSAFKEAYSFFEAHYEEIDVLAARIRFFDAKEKYHTLDYKFESGSRIANLDECQEHFSVQSTVATTFIKREAIGDLRFDTRLKYGEDAVFINKIIIQKRAYGLICESEYLYRRRSSSDSAVNTQKNDRSYYTDSLLYYHMELISLSLRMYGEVIPYIQAVVAYDLEWRVLKDDYKRVLDARGQTVYLETVKRILGYIDDRIIIKNPIHKIAYKKAGSFKLKYGEDYFREMVFVPEKGILRYHDTNVLNFKKTKGYFCRLDFVTIQEDCLHVEGRLRRWILNCTHSGGKFKALFNGKETEPELLPYKQKCILVEDEMINQYFRFSCEFDLNEAFLQDNEVRLQFEIYYGNDKVNLNLSYGKFVPNTNDFSQSYKCMGQYCAQMQRKFVQIVKMKHPVLARIRQERRYIRGLREIGRNDIAAIRMGYHFRKLFWRFKKKIWLISDRMDNAGDNGEVFFKYVCGLGLKTVKPVFVISREAGAVPRLQKTGKVCFFEEKKYLYYFLLSDKVISSGAGAFTTNPFGEDIIYYVDLFNFDYYYLQHGVACADLSSWLNRFNKNIHMVFTSSLREQEAFRSEDYYYKDDQIVLTGMARFDALRDGDEKQILILPTWRRSIRKSYDEATNSIYYEGFKDTPYFKFYNGLINDERLLNAMRRFGYKGLFCLHPIHKKQSVDFQGNDVFSINDGYVDYNKVFADSSLMVTDYSSVLFDFAYLRKPVVYAQFDKEKFFEDQIYDEGYFDYERDGFGPVCYDRERTVSAIISYLETGCKNQEKYLQRVNDFFAFSDHKNCERIYQTIINEANFLPERRLFDMIKKHQPDHSATAGMPDEK